MVNVLTFLVRDQYDPVLSKTFPSLSDSVLQVSQLISGQISFRSLLGTSSVREGVLVLVLVRSNLVHAITLQPHLASMDAISFSLLQPYY